MHAGPYLKLLALLGTAEEHEIIYAALRIPELQQQAIWALGHIGTVRAAESCLAGMQYENARPRMRRGVLLDHRRRSRTRSLWPS